VQRGIGRGDRSIPSGSPRPQSPRLWHSPLVADSSWMGLAVAWGRGGEVRHVGLGGLMGRATIFGSLWEGVKEVVGGLLE
jgi:hypothetical protein